MSDPTAHPTLPTDAAVPDPVGSAPQPPQGRVQANYWGVDETKNVFFPDGVTFVTIKTLAEGDRRKYLNATSKDMKLDRQSGEASIKMGLGDERYELLKASIVGWNLVRPKGTGDHEMQPVTFSKGTPGSELEKWLDVAPPSITETIEKEIRLLNSWLQADLTVEDIDKQIAELMEIRAKKVEDNEGNAG